MVTILTDIVISFETEQIARLINLSKRLGISVESLAMTSMMNGLTELEKEYELSKVVPKLVEEIEE